MRKIDVAKDFSMLPGPRYARQGKGSGEEFRDRHLKPAFEEALEKKEKILIRLDGVKYGYPTSFLEEAFGGLARLFAVDDVLNTLEFESTSEPMLIKEIRSYIERAHEIRGRG